MTDPLSLFWTRCEGPIVFGANDCCMTVADVILAAGGPDLMAEYRGRYTTRLGFVRAFRKAGYSELSEAVTASFASHGVEVDEPRDFDVAVVTYLNNGERTAAPAVFHSGFWFVRTDSGALASQGNPDRVWRVI